MESDASPEGASVQASLQGKTQPKQHQADQQAQHRPEAEVEAGMNQAEDQSLAAHCACRTNHLQLSPQPAAEEQLLHYANAKQQGQGIHAAPKGPFPKPVGPRPA